MMININIEYIYWHKLKENSCQKSFKWAKPSLALIAGHDGVPNTTKCQTLKLKLNFTITSNK